MSVVRESHAAVMVLRLDRPPVNALDAETLDELSDALESAAADEDVDAIVLTGAGKTMSAGADLRKVFDAEPAEIDEGIDALTRAFKTLFLFPKPAVAAVNGFALAGGAVLACGCDYRLIGEGAGAIGAVEVAAGVPFPAWALELIRHAVNNEHFQEIVLFGHMYSPPDAKSVGLVDEIVPDDRLMDRSLEVASELARIPVSTFSLTKRSVRAERAAAADSLMRFDDDVKDAWRSDEVKAAIRRQLDSLRAT